MVRGHAGLRARAHRLQGCPGHPADGPVRRRGAGATRGGANGFTRSVVLQILKYYNRSCKINYSCTRVRSIF